MSEPSTSGAMRKTVRQGRQPSSSYAREPMLRRNMAARGKDQGVVDRKEAQMRKDREADKAEAEREMAMRTTMDNSSSDSDEPPHHRYEPQAGAPCIGNHQFAPAGGQGVLRHTTAPCRGHLREEFGGGAILIPKNTPIYQVNPTTPYLTGKYPVSMKFEVADGHRFAGCTILVYAKNAFPFLVSQADQDPQTPAPADQLMEEEEGDSGKETQGPDSESEETQGPDSESLDLGATQPMETGAAEESDEASQGPEVETEPEPGCPCGLKGEELVQQDPRMHWHPECQHSNW